MFGSAEQFDEWFNLQIDDAEQKQRLITQLHKILRPFMLRRLKVIRRKAKGRRLSHTHKDKDRRLPAPLWSRVL